MAMFPPGVYRSHQGQGTKESFSGSRVAKLEGLEPHSTRGLPLPSAPMGGGAGRRGGRGKAVEVLAFLVMCLIYLLALGLGSLNPVDFLTMFLLEVRWLES